MEASEYIEHPFTDELNLGELEYREKIQPHEEDYNEITKWKKIIDEIDREILNRLYRSVEFKGVILELGAGSCWFGSTLSRIDSVEKVYCLDLSEHLLTNVAPHIMEYLGAETGKMVRVRGDFNRLHFSGSSLDFVVFDAALHHIPIDSFVKVFKEVHRVLKKQGKAAAVREPFLSSFPTARRRQKLDFGAHERRYGVEENIFSRNEWESMLSESGFSTRFIPVRIKHKRQKDDSGFKHSLRELAQMFPFNYLYFKYAPEYIMIMRKD